MSWELIIFNKDKTIKNNKVMYIVKYVNKGNENKVIDYLETMSPSDAIHAESVLSMCSDVHSVWVLEERCHPSRPSIPKEYEGRDYEKYRKYRLKFR